MQRSPLSGPNLTRFLARSVRSRLLLLVLLIAVLFLLSGCGVGVPQNTFAPDGEVARKEKEMFNYALWPAIAVFVIVESALVFAVIRFSRRSRGELPKQVHGNTRLEIAWTIVPAAILLALAVPMIALITDLGSAPASNPLRVKVIGHQWIWEFQYTDIKDAQGNPLTVIGAPDKPAELHIPVNREIDATITSADVIHSFWVPRLAGKTDAIPGRNNTMWFNAEKPGSYSGQCAEFCGLNHANMRFTVIAQSDQEFNDWVKSQGKTTAVPANPAAPVAVAAVRE